MTKQTATDKELSKLHKKVAKAMLQQLDDAEEAQKLLDRKYFDDEENEVFIPEDVRMFLKKCVSASPALLTAITKFLKDNEITCQVDESDEMSDLQKRLANKQRKSVSNVIPIGE